MISCSEATRRLWEYLEDSVDEAERRNIEDHLSLCLKCCGAAEFAKELSDFLLSHASDEMPAEVRARLSGFLEEL